MTLDLVLPACTSLKEKRRVLHGLLDKLRSSRNVSVAEVGYQDTHTRSIVAVACVGSQRAQVERILAHVERIVMSREGLEIIDHMMEWC